MEFPHEAERPVVSWGELLWDLFPDGPRLGGCAANVAYHVRRLGSACRLVSRVGDDLLGSDGISFMTKAGVDVSCVQVDPVAPTGSVHVDVSGPEPRFSIARQAAWDRIEWNDAVATAVANARVLYFGTLAQRTPLGATALARAVDAASPDCIKLCDLNVRQPFASAGVIEESVRRADVIKLNETEARYVAQSFGVHDPLEWLLAHPNVRLVALTRGERGSTLATRALRFEHAAVAYEGSGGDTVGAGDAFTAVLAHHLPALGANPSTLGLLANRYAGFVASRRGAMPEVPEDIVRSLQGSSGV
jgi:fructokinase